MPYRGNYPYYGRTQRALERLGGTLTEMSRGRTEEKRRKSAHELALAQLGVRRVGVEAGHEIGLLKTRAQQERERGMAAHRGEVLQLGRDKLEREQKREDYLKKEITGEEMLRQRLSGETPQNREAIIEEFKKQPSLGSLLSERVPRERWVPFGNKLFGGLEQLEKDRKEGTAKSQTDMAKDKKEYEGDLSKYNTVKSSRLRLAGQMSITEEDIAELKETAPAISALMIVFGGAGRKLDEKQAKELDLAYQNTENHYKRKIKEYEDEYGKSMPEFSFKERVDIGGETGVPEFEETERLDIKGETGVPEFAEPEEAVLPTEEKEKIKIIW